ncbi:MAG TPA: TolC family protein [Gemmatimonadales bacterium]|nr:TolC family protein [Gemmatimonadales bacterium]
MAATKRPVGLLLCGILLLTGQAAAQPPKLTLAEAIERANRVQPSVVQAFGSVRSAEARQRSATGAFLPNLSLNASRGLSFSEGQQLDPSTGQFVTSGSSTGSLGTSLSSNVDLFTGFRRTNEKKAANANRGAAEASLVNARSTQTLTTTNQFFDVLAAEQLLRVREASVRRAEEQLKVSVAILHAGRGIRPDSLRSVVTLGNAQLQLVNAQTALATAEANLGRLVGEDGPVGAVDDSSLYAMLPTVDSAALRAEALAQAPAVRAAEASAASARAAIGVAKAAYFPTLNLSGSLALNGSSRNSYNFLQSRQFSLGLNWPLFNRFQREQSIVNSEASAETADATAAEARRQVLASFTADLAALDAARLRIGITQTSVLAATEDLRVQQERYRLGAATIIEVLTSQEALSQAEVDAVTARFDYVRARAQISALIGRPL